MLCAPPARARARRCRYFFRVRKQVPPANGSECRRRIIRIALIDRQTEAPWHGHSQHSCKEGFAVAGCEPRGLRRVGKPGRAIIGT